MKRQLLIDWSVSIKYSAKLFSSLAPLTLLLFTLFCATFAIAAAIEEDDLSSSGVAVKLDGREKIRSEFMTPPALRDRVDFWIDIFAKYGSAHIVLHHRIYPQIVFLVIDLTAEKSRLNSVAFANLRTEVEKKSLERLKTIFQDLAEGKRAISTRHILVEKRMEMIPGGREKYRQAIDNGWLRAQIGIKERFAEAIARSGRYLDYIDSVIVGRYRLPRELSLLPLIESSFDYSAYSSVGAAGIWQLMPKTAQVLGLEVGKAVDQRRDPIAATEAAARYLARAYERLGSWPLAITSYNHGVAGVAAKVQKFGTSDIVKLVEYPPSDERPFGFASSNFYPEFLAALEVYYSCRFYFPETTLDEPFAYREYRFDRPVSAVYASRFLGLAIEDLKEYNLSLTSAVWNGKYNIPARFPVRLPLGRPAHPVQSFAVSNVYGGSVYTVRKGDTLLKIAQRTNHTVAELKELNNLQDAQVKIGQVLVLSRPENADQRSKTTDSQTTKEISKKAVVRKNTNTYVKNYTVKPGDNLWSIAKKHNVAVDKISRLPGVAKNAPLKVGEKLTISHGGK
ncbi:MAG TPA: LysM peptidoglycan-binding domain-containing protein [Oligoflexia bacterium]|nr:LysM peptidoglycan-binding domain-containing protein [Oligoflexia bacterium]HMP27576.1 LysM peptidoglycan-binding domain-containing protein [Oligoflexia bacterium]